MSRTTGWLVAGAILIGSVALAALMISLRPEPERRPAPSQVPFALTAPVEAGEGAIPVHGAGTVRPRAEVDVAAEVGGKVVWVDPAFQSGGRVREDQPLFRLDDADYRNAVERARADLAAQNVELVRAQEEARVARSQYERFKERQAGDGAPSEVSPLALGEPQLEAARAALARRRTVLAEAELNLARTEVRAPFDGVVRTESVDVGQFVAAGQGVARLYADDAVEVVVPLSDAAAALLPGLWALRAGDDDRRMAVRVVAAYGDASYSWNGHVDRAETSLDEQTRTIDVIVRVPRPFAPGAPAAGSGNGDEAGETAGGPPLLVGKFVDVEIEGMTPDEYFKLRRPALRPGNEVWAVRGGSVTIVPLKVLQRLDDDVYATGALEAGDRLVIGGIDFATDGMVVRTQAAPTP